ncbi:MAG TPA: hypothetical protein VMG98_11290 [Verrucomicrobiae bacterium]|nr:hypothetical protein [Verrucomicrobiae bacterium]
MISERDDEQERSDDRATLMWSLLVSGFLNLMGWMFVAWTIAVRTHAMAVAQNPPPQETFMVTSSSMRIAQRSHPVPRQANQQPATQQQAQRPAAATQPRQPEPKAQPTEIARITPSAPPQPRSAPKRTQQATLAETLAQQQVAFEHEAQQLNQQHGPISIATIDPSQRESATHQYRINFGGNSELRGRGEGILSEVLRAWIEPGTGRHCYYIQYQWLYPAGGIEQGDVPWPFCYPPNADLIGRGIRTIPIETPPPGYQLPAGTELYPIEKQVYEAWLHGNPP